MTTATLRAKLRQNLVDYFSEEDLRTLCFDLGLDYEILPGSGKAGKAREIVAHAERLGRVSELVEQCRQRRPNVQWEEWSKTSVSSDLGMDTEPVVDSKSSSSTTGDVITVKQIEKGSVVAAGRGARANVFNINIRDIRWTPLLVVIPVLLVIIGVLLYLFFQLRPSTPATMPSETFNVAVAEFAVQDKNGKPQQNPDAIKLARFLTERVRTNFEELDLKRITGYEVWGPERTGPVAGGTREIRSQTAEALAKKIGAHIVIYGVITSDGVRSLFAPEFYVNHASFQEAGEITGLHPFGRALSISLPLGERIQAIENPALASRSSAISMITIGLAYYSLGDFENALKYFAVPEADKRWIESAGKEMVYLLLGNANLRLASKKLVTDEHLPKASGYYSEALRINPSYGRALLGQADVLRRMAQENPADPNYGANLVAAEGLLDRALQLEDQPDSALIPSKVHFKRGQIAVARAVGQLPGADWWLQAQAEFQIVIAAYEQGDTRLKELASFSYAQLGGIAGVRGQADQAVELYQKAINIAAPFYQSVYWALLGDVYKNTDKIKLARSAYTEAERLAEAAGDAESVQKYNGLLKALPVGD